MFQLLLSLLFVVNAHAQEVVDVWPKGTVPAETSHVKILFAKEMVKDEGVAPKEEWLDFPGIGIHDCLWDMPRLLHCKFQKPLGAGVEYTIKGKGKFQFEQKFKTDDLALMDYFETLEQNKFRLAFDFNAPIQTQKAKIQVACDKQKPLAFIGEIVPSGNTWKMALPMEAPKDAYCFFHFPEGLNDANGKKHAVKGKWLLKGQQSANAFTGSVNSFGCEVFNLWHGDSQHQDKTPVARVWCEKGTRIYFNPKDKNSTVEVYPPIASVKRTDWSAEIVIPENAPASFNIIVRNKVRPEWIQSYLVEVFPAGFSRKNYAELDDNGSYFEAKEPWLMQLNHRDTSSVALGALRLTDDADIANQVTREYYSERREPRSIDKDNIRRFNLPYDGGVGFKTGIDIKQLPGISSGVWWVQSLADMGSLASPDRTPLNSEKDRTSISVVQYTDLGVHLKKGLKGGVAWVFSLSKGKPVEDAEVSYVVNSKTHKLGRTDKNGIVAIGEEHQNNGVIIARKDEDMVAMPLNYRLQSGISNWDFGISMVDAESLEWSFDAIPSNPLNRPGEKVSLKVFARKSGLKGPELATLKDADWSVTDPRGEKVASGKIDFNKFGTALINIKLDTEAVSGKYQLTIGRQTLEPFSVEVFQTPTLKVTMDQLTKAQGPLTVSGLVEFHVGGGVQDTEGEAALIVRSRPFSPPGQYEMFDFDHYNGSTNAELIGKTEFKTDKMGVFKANFSRFELPEFGSLIAEATVKDGDGASISGRTEIPVASRGWFPGVRLDDYVYNEGATVSPSVIVLDINGKPVAGVKFKAEFIHRSWNTVRRLGSGNAYYYDSVEKSEKAGNCEGTSALEAASCDFKPTGEGSYEVLVTTQHLGKSGPQRRLSFWVPGPNSWGWGARNNHDRIDIRAEKNKYEYGETARFLIQSPYPEGKALVTVERYGVIKHEVINFKGGFWTYELKLDQESYVPGVYFSVVLLKGRSAEKFEGGVDLGRPSFKMGYTQIQVAQTPMVLNVKANAEKRYAPGDEVELSLDVRDWKNKKIDGEIAVTVVDDAILQLVPGYKNYFEVMDTFYHIKGLGVWNYQTLTRLIGRRSFGKKGAIAGGGGGNGADALRSNFKSVAHFEPMLEVEDGKAKIKFKLPDNLTNWRVIAVAVDEKHRMGVGETTFRAVRPVMLTPFFPPFARTGDDFTAAFGVQNATEQTINATLEAKVSGLTPEKVTGEKSVEPGLRELMNFPFKASKAGMQTLEATVKAGKDRDGLRTSFPVLHEMGVKHVSGGLIPLTASQRMEFTLPKTAIEGTGKAKLKLSKSILDGLDEAFAYTVGYPYGCWEQQTTGALFLAEYKEMQPWLAEFKFDESKGDARESIQKYLDKAASYQTPDGTMAYYPGSYSDPYLTVFTGHAFGVFQSAGFKISEEVTRKLRERLLAMKDHNGELGRFTAFKESMKAYIAAILVDLKDAEGHKLATSLFSQRQKMDLFGKGMLLKALPKDSKSAKTLMDELLKATDSTGSTVNFTEKMSPDAKNWLYSARRGQCVAVDALLRHGVNNALAAKMVLGLAPDKKTARWGNTQENYFCFQTFRTYARLFESTDKEAVVEIKSEDTVESHEVKRLQNVSMEFLEKNRVIPTAMATLKSGGNAYVFTRVSWETKAEDAIATQNGFSLTKTVEVKKGNQWVALKGKTWTVKKGDSLRVKLSVRSTGERFKVGLNDPIPAGWRALNTRLATTSLATQVEAGVTEDQQPKQYDWWEWYNPSGFSASDMRLSSVQYFANSLDSHRTYDVEYLAQAATVGEFFLPGTTVEEMYDEEFRATTEAVRVRVTE